MVSASVFAILAVAVAMGALVQGAVGLGLGLVAAPVITLVDASLMPDVMLWLASVYPLATLVREWRDSDWRGLGWAFAGRLPGTAVGIVVVAWASTQVLGLLVGTMVLLAVVLTVRVVRLPMTPGVLVGAGVIGGVTGTATSIGGPPLAIVYQHESGPRLRATLGAYFIGGGLLSLVGLGLTGQLDRDDGLVALMLSPFLLVGLGLAALVRRHVDAGHTRAAVLIVCAASALALIVRSSLA